MRGDEGGAGAAWYLLPSAFAYVVGPLSRVRLSRVSVSDVPPGRFVCLFVCIGRSLVPPSDKGPPSDMALN